MFRKVLSWMAVIVWMMLIFFMSAQIAEESNGLSVGITEKIIEQIEERLPEIQVDRFKLNHIVRKSAHFIAYFVLGFLVANALVDFERKGRAHYFKGLILCILYAVSDEIHQLFVPGRGGQLKDVLLDSFGALAGLLSYAALVWLVDKLLLLKEQYNFKKGKRGAENEIRLS